MLNTLRRRINTLHTHSGFRRYAINTSWMLAEQVLRIISGLVVGIWVARYLGPEQFGLFSYVLAFTAIFGGIAKLGFDSVLVRELLNQPECRDIYLGTAFWLKIIAALLVLVLMALVVPFTSNDATVSLFIYIIVVGFIFQGFEVIEFYFQSQVLARVVSVCKLGQLAFSSLLKVYLVINEAVLFWFVCVTVFDALSLAISYLIAYKIKSDRLFFKKFDAGIAKRLLKDSWPLMFSSVFAMIYLRIDQVMIKEMLGSHEVGVYSAAVKLAEAFYFLPALITVSIFPAILNAKKLDIQLYYSRLQSLYSLLVWLAMSIAVIFNFFGGELLVYLFGDEYAAAGDVLVVYVWSNVFVFISAGFGRYLVVENLAIINMYRVVLGALLNVMLNLFMIERYGVVGAAYSTLISLFVVNYAFDFFSAKLHLQLRFKIAAVFCPVILLARLLRRF